MAEKKTTGEDQKTQPEVTAKFKWEFTFLVPDKETKGTAEVPITVTTEIDDEKHAFEIAYEKALKDFGNGSGFTYSQKFHKEHI